MQEMKLFALEHSLEEVQERNRQLEKIWLREQGHMIALSEQRQDQLQQLNIFRKRKNYKQRRRRSIYIFLGRDNGFGAEKFEDQRRDRESETAGRTNDEEHKQVEKPDRG